MQKREARSRTCGTLGDWNYDASMRENRGLALYAKALTLAPLPRLPWLA